MNNEPLHPDNALPISTDPILYPRSSNIFSIRYFPKAAILHIAFKDKNGMRTNTYNYAGVQEAEFVALRDASPSIGAYFSAHFRTKYPGTKIAPEDLEALESERVAAEVAA